MVNGLVQFNIGQLLSRYLHSTTIWPFGIIISKALILILSMFIALQSFPYYANWINNSIALDTLNQMKVSHTNLVRAPGPWLELFQNHIKRQWRMDYHVLCLLSWQWYQMMMDKKLNPHPSGNLCSYWSIRYVDGRCQSLFEICKNTFSESIEKYTGIQVRIFPSP